MSIQSKLYGPWYKKILPFRTDHPVVIQGKLILQDFSRIKYEDELVSANVH